MKVKIFAFVLMGLLITSVTVNTCIVSSEMKKIQRAVDDIKFDESSIETSLLQANAAYSIYQEREIFLSLTVNHNDLTNIEDNFAEMIGNLMVGDSDGAEITRNRLSCSLEHLRRLSGINIDALI